MESGMTSKVKERDGHRPNRKGKIEKGRKRVNGWGRVRAERRKDTGTGRN